MTTTSAPNIGSRVIAKLYNRRTIEGEVVGYFIANPYMACATIRTDNGIVVSVPTHRISEVS